MRFTKLIMSPHAYAKYSLLAFQKLTEILVLKSILTRSNTNLLCNCLVFGGSLLEKNTIKKEKIMTRKRLGITLKSIQI